MNVASRAMVVLDMESFCYIALGGTPGQCSSMSCKIPFSVFVHFSEREPDPPPSRQRYAGRGSTQTSRAPHPHSAAPAPQSSRPRANLARPGQEMEVDAIFSAHSDGLMVIIRHAATVED